MKICYMMRLIVNGDEINIKNLALHCFCCFTVCNFMEHYSIIYITYYLFLKQKL